MKKRVVLTHKTKPALGKKVVVLQEGCSYDQIITLARQKLADSKINSCCLEDDTIVNSSDDVENGHTLLFFVDNTSRMPTEAPWPPPAPPLVAPISHPPTSTCNAVRATAAVRAESGRHESSLYHYDGDNEYDFGDGTDVDGESAPVITKAQGAFDKDVFKRYVVYMITKKAKGKHDSRSVVVEELTEQQVAAVRTVTKPSMHAKERIAERYSDIMQEFNRSMYMGDDCLYNVQTRYTLLVEGGLEIICTTDLQHITELRRREKRFLPKRHQALTRSDAEEGVHVLRQALNRYIDDRGENILDLKEMIPDLNSPLIDALKHKCYHNSTVHLHTTTSTLIFSEDFKALVTCYNSEPSYSKWKKTVDRPLQVKTAKRDLVAQAYCDLTVEERIMSHRSRSKQHVIKGQRRKNLSYRGKWKFPPPLPPTTYIKTTTKKEEKEKRNEKEEEEQARKKVNESAASTKVIKGQKRKNLSYRGKGRCPPPLPPTTHIKEKKTTKTEEKEKRNEKEEKKQARKKES